MIAFELAPARISNGLFDKSSNGGRGSGAGLSRHFSSVSKERKQWNGAHLKALRNFWKVFCVHLHNQPVAGRFGGNFDQLGRQHFTRTAPWRPKIHQHRNRCPRDNHIKLALAPRLDRFRRRRQFRAALPATEALAQPVVSQPIASAALGASNNYPAFIDCKHVHGEKV